VIGGLIVATFSTLLFVPLIFSLANKRNKLLAAGGNADVDS
jgi:hypothetical protein